LVVGAFGGGKNSHAWVVRWVSENRPLDLLLFADTGAELPETYCAVEKMSHWLARKGYPEIITVKHKTKDGLEETLEQECLRTKTLPSVAYGFEEHTCSSKFKIAPQNKFINNWEPAQSEWAKGRKIIKIIGYDFGEEHRVVKAMRRQPDANKYKLVFPLFSWGLTRRACSWLCNINGFNPSKSSCFFCSSMHQIEIREMAHKYPELADRAVAMERNAKPNLKTIKGLGVDYSWENLLKHGEMFPERFPEARGTEICCDCYDG
jgi:hypothetical protein